MSMDPSSSRSQAELLKKEREQFRAQIAADDDDALAPYERYVNWLTEQARVSPQGPFDLELLTVLEEAVRPRKDDPDYKNDVRYAKLWLAYARHVEKPDIIYVFLLKNEIGVRNAQLYEDYSMSLESQDRFREAEEAYRLGISRSKRGADRLKTRYWEFKQRVETKSTLKATRKPPYVPPGEGSSLGAKLYRNPLRNISSKRARTSNSGPDVAAAAAPENPTPSPNKVESVENRKSDPYAYMTAAMNAPTAPGKKVEKYRFDMSLLFCDGQEFSIQEARAASLGLLGKKWGAPPASELGPPKPASTKQATVSLKDEGGSRPATKTNHLRVNTNMTAQLADGPTVTLNTKEALKDVFGMYNSPDRTMKTTNLAGSKHAPVTKLDAQAAAQSRNALKKITEVGNENEQRNAPFRPFVDNENKKENAAPAPAKFKPFVDENLNNKTPHVTPKPRKGLAVKEIPVQTPVNKLREQSEDEDSVDERDTEELQPRNAFGRVFTPVNQTEKTRPALQPKVLQERPSVFRDSQQSNGQTHGVLGSKVFSRPAEARPLSQPQAFSTPGNSQENGPNGSAFQRSTSAPQRFAFTPVSRDRQVQAFTPRRTPLQPVEPEPEPESEYEPEHEPEAELEPEPELEEEIVEEIEDYGEDFESDSPASEVLQEDEEVGYYDEEDYQSMPMGGRLGHVDVMTPIAERTFECTVTSRTMLGTPGDANGSVLDRGLPNHGKDAALAAERLAQELREEEERARAREADVDMEDVVNIEDDESSEVDVETEEDELVERTGTLSLADAIAVASSFKPPNPCNPSDPHILNTLISLIPQEPEFHDLRTEVSGQFDSLQKFASKQGRRGSSRSSSSRTSDSADFFRIQLPDRAFKVLDKLGEGGFGAVFRAKVIRSIEDEDGDDMDSDDEDSDDEDVSRFALKVVKPRNIWEYHILRRIHSVLPAHCRQSVITPHALFAYQDESFLILDLCTQGTLLDVVNRAGEAGILHQGACLDELLVMFFTIELIKFVESMHSIGFIHGDLKIDNCLLRLEDVPGGTNAWSGMYQSTGEGGWKYKGIKMIDFGRTIDTRMYPAGQQFIADWETDVRDCPAMRENRSWTYETDYFGLAGIVYCMLFGKYFDNGTVVPDSDDDSKSETRRYKLATQFKRYWQTEIWTRLFDLLLNPTLARPDRSLPLVPELTETREEMETWLSSNCNRSSNTLKGLLKKVERSVLSCSR
ncbi:uncharacterized protein FOMMEDRAFT_144565 [Fomitiporia mediterranea MF3/22]|uniref:uncharacterized protein n=1 Tax=Fomitiporia mediterranea (strain MF3/22) TaxID=694068 RepID=UPI0004408346|nr:uncharacterized protein FOMMEDRAFT_144565 [Fomitiporia mediterranea MF3/22]EJD06579.1 hypothetical protein FOMMEDRAFT_144565 [Fomitiporia mediterranea MF3/22]